MMHTLIVIFFLQSSLCIQAEASQISGYPFKYEDDLSCPGRYCGRMELKLDSPCGACPRGFAPDSSSLCIPCERPPGLYDWLYLAFMALLPLCLHTAAIDRLTSPPHDRWVGVVHGVAGLEAAAAAVLTLLAAQPAGQLGLHTCGVNSFSDWYSMLFNPSPDLSSTLYCTQEIVYPLYSIVLIYYTFSLVLMMIIRPLCARCLPRIAVSGSVYAALYFLPVLIIAHSVLGGVIYYTFPYLTVVASLLTSAIHLASWDDQRSWPLLKATVTSPRSVAVTLAHWLVHGFGVVAITQLHQPWVHLPLLCLVPLPTFFYMATVRYTDPNLIFPFRTSSLSGV